MKKLRMILPVVVLAVVAGIFSTMYLQVNAKAADNRISEGIYIESVYIGGMTESEAQAALDAYIEELSTKEFTLTAGDKQIRFDASEMGFAVTNEGIVQEAMAVGKTGSLLKRYKDLTDLEQGDLVLALDVAIDTEIVTTLLNDNLKKIDTKAVNNGLIRKNGEFTYVPGRTGIAVNVGPSVALMLQNYWNQYPRHPGVK